MFRQYREIEKGEFIVAGGDLSAGGIDRSATAFISKTRLDIPLVYHSQLLATEMTNAVAPVLEKIFDITGIRPVVGFERSDMGSENERLAAMNHKGKYEVFRMPERIGKAPDGKPIHSYKLGWETNSATRKLMLTDWKQAVDNGIIKMYDLPMLEEHISFVIVQTSSAWKAQAEIHAHDDLVIAPAIAYQIFLRTPEVSEVTRRPGYSGQKRKFNPATV